MTQQTKAEKLRKERWPEIRKRVEEGESYSAIAKDIGVSPATMLKWLMEEGYKYRTKGRYPQAMRRRVKELVDQQDWEIEDVALLLQIDKTLAARWYTEPLPESKKRPKKNPAPRRHQLSAQAQRLISDPRIPRHKRGRKWEAEQKHFVVDLIRKRFSIIEIYRISGASKARQSKIWKELVSKRRTPPNFPSEEGPAMPRRALRETQAQRQRRSRRQLTAQRRRHAIDRSEGRRKALQEGRHAAIREGEEPPGALPPPRPEGPVVPPPAPESTRVFIEPRALPPSRETALPRPPWEKKRKKKPKKKKKKREF